MNSSIQGARAVVHDYVMELAWRQWSALGIAGRRTAPEIHVVDPEALILLTMRVGS
jgi:hypothetical protein